jgi:hypothetical protein
MMMVVRNLLKHIDMNVILMYISKTFYDIDNNDNPDLVNDSFIMQNTIKESILNISPEYEINWFKYGFFKSLIPNSKTYFIDNIDDNLIIDFNLDFAKSDACLVHIDLFNASVIQYLVDTIPSKNFNYNKDLKIKVGELIDLKTGKIYNSLINFIQKNEINLEATDIEDIIYPTNKRILPGLTYVDKSDEISKLFEEALYNDKLKYKYIKIVDKKYNNNVSDITYNKFKEYNPHFEGLIINSNIDNIINHLNDKKIALCAIDFNSEFYNLYNKFIKNKSYNKKIILTVDVSDKFTQQHVTKFILENVKHIRYMIRIIPYKDDIVGIQLFNELKTINIDLIFNTYDE